MHAHSQFCMSGDYTLEATDTSIKDLAQEEADEHFLVVLSDANLERYGIRPERLANVLTSDPQVNAFVIFIGSLGDQAERWGGGNEGWGTVADERVVVKTTDWKVNKDIRETCLYKE